MPTTRPPGTYAARRTIFSCRRHRARSGTQRKGDVRVLGLAVRWLCAAAVGCAQKRQSQLIHRLEAVIIRERWFVGQREQLSIREII